MKNGCRSFCGARKAGEAKWVETIDRLTGQFVRGANQNSAYWILGENADSFHGLMADPYDIRADAEPSGYASMPEGEYETIQAPRLTFNLRDPTKMSELPGWVPCTACLEPWAVHLDGHCPFDATTFSPDVPEAWKTLHEAIAICGYETRSPFLDLLIPVRMQYYLEAWRVRQNRLRKQKESR